MSFNLTTEKWIPVVDKHWNREQISLIELFETCQNFREIQAENPLVTFSIYRLILAIMHRAYQGPKDVDHWEEIKNNGGKIAIEYLRNKADCFDLLHPERPFMQDITISEEKTGDIYMAAKIQGGNTSTLFCHHYDGSGYWLTIEEAARLIVRLNVFDLAGKKSGSSDSAKTIRMMNAANILVRGKTLADTIMLNLMQYNPKQEIPSPIHGEDLPSWERPASSPQERIPSGYIDYLTYQWRRLRLVFDGKKAIKIASHLGDSLPKSISESTWECGIAYRKNKDELKSVKLEEKKVIWRDLHTFLQSTNSSSCLRILEWILELKSEDLIKGILHLQIFGLIADQGKPFIWLDEHCSIPVQFLTVSELGQSLNLAITIVEDHKKLFRYGEGNPYYVLAKELKNNAEKLADSLNGEFLYWSTLSIKFMELLDSLPKDQHILEDGTITYGKNELPKWTQTVQQAAKHAFSESIKPIYSYKARAKSLDIFQKQLRKLCPSIHN